MAKIRVKTEEEYPLTIMDLVEGEEYLLEGDDTDNSFPFDPADLAGLCQSDRFKLVEKKPEVIETKFYIDKLGIIFACSKDDNIGGDMRKVKPLDDTFTRWERV